MGLTQAQIFFMEFKSILKWLLLTPVIVLGLVLLLILPLLVLIKGTVMSYQSEMGYLISLLIGGLAAFVVLLTYLIAIDRVAGRQVFFNIWIKLGVAAISVLSFMLYSMYVLNDENVKNRRIASQYTQTHPVLRLGLQSWSLFDRKLVITDIARSLSFYRRHRMRTYHRSLHFPQKYLDGRVYALDIRTKGRGKFRNWITQVMFRMMGFGTLRHTGTADHLHIELPLRKSDKRKIAYATRHIRKRYRERRRKKRTLLAEQRRDRKRRLQELRAEKTRNQRRLDEIIRERKNQGHQNQGLQNGIVTIKPAAGMRNANSMAGAGDTKSDTAVRSSDSTTDDSTKITSRATTQSPVKPSVESELVNDDGNNTQ